MYEYQFDFENGSRNDHWNHFLKNQFINKINWRSLNWLYCIFLKPLPTFWHHLQSPNWGSLFPVQYPPPATSTVPQEPTVPNTQSVQSLLLRYQGFYPLKQTASECIKLQALSRCQTLILVLNRGVGCAVNYWVKRRLDQWEGLTLYIATLGSKRTSSFSVAHKSTREQWPGKNFKTLNGIN